MTTKIEGVESNVADGKLLGCYDILVQTRTNIFEGRAYWGEEWAEE